MNCIKLLGQSLMVRDFERQVAELQVRIAVLNGCTALGIPVTVVIGEIRPGKGKIHLQPICKKKAAVEVGSGPNRQNSPGFDRD